jgi:hypothetical protein
MYFVMYNIQESRTEMNLSLCFSELLARNKHLLSIYQDSGLSVNTHIYYYMLFQRGMTLVLGCMLRKLCQIKGEWK